MTAIWFLCCRFHLPSHQACARLGISLSVLKRVCRKQGIPRWAKGAAVAVKHRHTNIDVYLAGWMGAPFSFVVLLVLEGV